MRIEEIKTILVIGAGTLGTQIALQSAMHGFDVNLYDISDEALAKGMQLIDDYIRGVQGYGVLDAAQAGEALKRIHPTTDPAQAARAQIVSESVPEDPALKARVFAQFNALCPPETIFTTNTSSLVPSMFAEATGRPERFAALHFHGYVWISNVVDIMPHPGTSDETLDLLEAFARRIGQVPIRLTRESYAYVFNAMLNALLRSATTLAASGVTSFQNVDRAWMGVMKSPIGPFGMMDQIGLETVYHINQYWATALNDAELQRNADFVRPYVEQGKLGMKTGQGFYSYPNAEFQQPGFVGGDVKE